jgi:hypothetical protein
VGVSGLFLRNSMAEGIAIASVEVPHHLEEEVLNVATEALDYARDNAPWADRTGDARNGLDVDVRMEGDVIVWEMSHGVDYGLYLETRWNGKYAIIMPTLEMFAPRIGRGLDESGGDFGG